MKLGLLLRRAGKRTRAFIGGDDVECHWGTTVPEHDQDHGEELFCGDGFPAWLVLAVGCLAAMLFCAAVIGP